MNTKFFSPLKLSLVTILLVVSGAAYADYWTFPGTHCMEEGDTSPEMKYEKSNIQNMHPEDKQAVICPVNMDKVEVYGGEISVVVQDTHPEIDIDCRLIEAKKHGEVIFKGDWYGTSGQERKTIILGTVGYGVNTNVFIRCKLPNRRGNSTSKIYSYMIKK